MACKNCNSLAQKRRFSSSGEVTRFIRRLRTLVEDGRIVEFPSHTDFDRIEDDASWPPSIDCSFGCPDCGQGFAFTANSQRGKPAQWLPTKAAHRRR
jgi:hypothetical protein